MPHAILILCFSAAVVMGKPLNQASDPAQPCDETKCQLPQCRCASTEVPGGLAAKSIPQIITISFDDGFRTQDYETYYKPIFGDRKNPNGCPIGITYFVSNNYSDYALMEDVYANEGAEFADHSVTHRTPTTWWKEASAEELTHEINDQKTIMELWGGVPKDAIKGFRAPFLVTSETELSVLHDNKFSYEASMGTNTHYWPYTLDYKSPICIDPATCPVNSYPGLWLVPIVLYNQSNGVSCPMLDACTVPVTKQDWLDFLWDNFYAHYNDSRTPFGLYSHVAWLYLSDARAEALKEFLGKVLTAEDVYVVTHSQMLDWVRNPVPTSKIADFDPWKCPGRSPPRCSYKNPTCSTTFDNIQFKSCSSCPHSYPTYGNPSGN